MRPLGTTEQTYQRLEHLLGHDRPYPQPPAPETPMALYGNLLDALQANGAQGAEVRPLVDELLATAAEKELTTGSNKAIPRLYMREAQNLENVANGAKQLPLMQAEKIKRALQSDARFGQFKDTPLNDAKKQIAGALRQANETAVEKAAAAAPMGSQLRAVGEQFAPAKKLIGQLLEAEQAAREGASRGAHRATFDLPEKIELMNSLAEGRTGGLLTTIAHALARPFGPTTLASTAYSLRRPDLVAQLAASLQRGRATGEQAAPVTAQPVGRDEQGRPILVIHTGS